MADPVWVVVMFDLPVKKREEVRAANQYRKLLLESGFSPVQYSVYTKYLLNATGLRALIKPLKAAVPPNGEVRIIQLTDTQWASQLRFFGSKRLEPEERPKPLAIFDDAEGAQVPLFIG